MTKKTRIIIAGAVVGVLAILVIYLNFFTGESTPPEAEDALKAAQEHAQTAPPPEPEPVMKAPKQMEGFKKDR